MHFYLRTLGLSLFLCATQVAVANGEGKFFTADGICYKTVGTSVHVSDLRSEGRKYSGDIVIPGTVVYDDTTYNVTTILDSAFMDCTGLTSITLPYGLRQIDSHSFKGCTALTDVIVPSTVKAINPEAFYGCTGLTSVILSKDLTFLGSNAFGGCTKLERVVFPKKILPLMLQFIKSFDDANYQSATLYVPLDCSANFSSNRYWNFQNIVEMGNIVDGEPYTQQFEVTTSVRYTRLFKNTNWQSLYVPFAIPVDSLTAHGLKVAAMNDTHQYDNNQDGVADSTKMEFFTLVSGSTQPNYPYLIKSSVADSVVLNLPDVLIQAAAQNSIECSSITQRFTFVGTYDGVSGNEMFAHTYYAMAGGGLKRPASSAVSLKPQRWYMSIENKDGTPVVDYLAPSIRFSIDGMDEVEPVTAIEDCRATSSADGAYYTLDGSCAATRSLRPGLSVHQGKIILIRQ